MTKLIKRCFKCKTEKPISEFYKNRTQPDGLAGDCRVCHREYVKIWQKRNPEKTNRWNKISYNKRYGDPTTRRHILDNNIVYNKTHKKQINEWQRKRRYQKLGRPIRIKSFVLYRDVIKFWMQETLDVSGPKWKLLLSLPLTAKQRQLVELAMQGISLSGMASLLKRNQSNITKMWNGDRNNKGGIAGKIKKFAPHIWNGFK